MSSDDLILVNTDGVTNRVGLTLWKDAPGLPGGFREDIVSPLPVPDGVDDVNYQGMSPEFGRVFDQQNWVDGFGEGRVHDSNRESHYGYTEGVLAMFEHELIPSYQEDRVDMLVQNGRFENGSVSEWNGTNATLAISTSARSGSYAMQATMDANNGTVSQVDGGRLSVWTDRVIKVTAYVKRVSGTGSMLLRVTGDSSGDTDSSASTSTDWTFVSVEKTLTSDTFPTFTFLGSTSGDVWLIDDIAVIPAGGVQFRSRPVEFQDEFYIASGRCVLKWHEGDDCWYAVYVDATNVITDLASFGGNLYAARGVEDNYIYTTGADDTVWVDPATNSGNNALATKFARVQNSVYNDALLKTRANQVSLTTDPTDTANWGAEIQVGDTDRSVTSVLSTNGIAYIGREDGLQVYDRSQNKFRDLEPDANFFPASDNFAVSIGRGGTVLAGGGQQTFWRISPVEIGTTIQHRWEDLTELLAAPAFKGYGGRVTALAQDRQNVWVAITDDAAASVTEFPYTFPVTFSRPNDSSKVRLLVLRPPAKDKGDFTRLDRLVPHTISAFTMTTTDQMGRLRSESRSSLFVFGRSYNSDIESAAAGVDEPAIYRLRLPVSADNPRQAVSIELRTSGTFYTSWLDYDFPDVEKALAKLIINSRNLAAGGNTLTVSYKTDDATDDDTTGWTVFPGSALGVVKTSPSQTLEVSDTPVTFKRIRLKIAFSSTSSSAAPPTITGIVLHSVWNPGDFRQFTAIAKLSDRRSLQLRRGRRDGSRHVDTARLALLRLQPFVNVTTPYGETYKATIRYRRTNMSSRVDSLRGGKPDFTEVIQIDGTEVRTT